MENLPENWNLVEECDGNFIFEDDEQEFSVSIDLMGRLEPPYVISYQQLKEEFTKIGLRRAVIPLMLRMKLRLLNV